MSILRLPAWNDDDDDYDQVIWGRLFLWGNITFDTQHYILDKLERYAILLSEES